jgi:hypothetical protein
MIPVLATIAIVVGASYVVNRIKTSNADVEPGNGNKSIGINGSLVF